MKKSVKRKCKRTKHNKYTMHHKNKKTHSRGQRGGNLSLENMFDEIIYPFMHDTSNRKIQNFIAKSRVSELRFVVCKEHFKPAPSLMYFTLDDLVDFGRLLFTQMNTKWYKQSGLVGKMQLPNPLPLGWVMKDSKYINIFNNNSQHDVPTTPAKGEAEWIRSIKTAAPIGAAAPSGAAVARPSSGAVATGVAMPASDTRKEAPHDWTRVGNIWKGPNGAYAPQDYYKPRPN